MAALLCTNIFQLQAPQIDHTLRFDQNGDVAQPEFLEKLKMWFACNYHYRNDQLELRGHADSDSDNDFNFSLSER